MTKTTGIEMQTSPLDELKAARREQDAAIAALLSQNAELFKQMGATYQARAEAAMSDEERRAEYLKSGISSRIDGFLAHIVETARTPKIKTGFPVLDKMLGGGLYEGLFMIGAVSSLGKSAFAIEIMNRAAQEGNTVLFYSFEMSRNEIVARSISRLTADRATRSGRPCRKSTIGILGGEWLNNEEEKEVIITLAREYQALAEGKIFIAENKDGINLATISRDIETHIEVTGQRPLVIIDYLQILPPPSVTGYGNMTDKQAVDKNMTLLNQMSRNYSIPVIVISSFNRENYLKTASLSSLKESGGIEYSADVVIGLQRSGTGDKIVKQEDLEAAMIEEERTGKRQIEAVILKNRNGIPGGRIGYIYTPAINLITETGAISKLDKIKI